MNTEIKSPSAIAAHTPGPWISDGRSIETCDLLVEDNPDLGGITLATVFPPADIQAKSGVAVALKTAEANARLIAAAPELLGVLEDLVYLFSDDTDPRWISAESAIRKAKGGAL